MTTGPSRGTMTLLVACALIGAALALLTGCATGPRVESGNERSVVVSKAFDRGEATQVADRHCAQHGRHARFHAQIAAWILAYDCVE